MLTPFLTVIFGLELYMSLNDYSMHAKEAALIREIAEKYPPIAEADIGDMEVIERFSGEFFAIIKMKDLPPPQEFSPYDVDIAAQDIDGSPVGIALWFSVGIPLSKIHAFRYDEKNIIHVVPGSVEVY